MDHQTPVAAFIQRWRGVSGSERANYQLFIADLCDLLGVPHPEPAHDQTRDNAYVFERRVTFAHGDGSQSNGFIDCYKRGAFVLEAKKVKAGAHTKGFDDALLRARSQAEGYARALPAAEGRPPFVVAVDVGHVIELYAEFTRSGATYTPFPDARSHRIRLDDLHEADLRERLRLLWLDPMALDPARASAKVTRQVAVQLAQVARSLEAAGHAPQLVAAFLTRCLFSMFAEDVELLPRTAGGEGAFVSLLKQYGDQPDTLQRMLRALWTDMDRGGFSAALAKDVLRFNGKLFKASASDGYVLPLNREQIDGLIQAADADWREVEPAIFGTLLERALDPTERHALGAHYTPRAYVERLVLPTVVEPLRADWANAQAAALLLATEANSLDGKKRDDKLAEARAEIKRFHHQLCTVRVLDPACGSGNFLYVTLEHLKRLEGEVLDQLQALGETQSRLGLEGETVTLQQLRGIELNERAAALAELVLWIGFLQWHIRTFGNASVAEPVVHDYGNIEHRDAVLAYDDVVPMRDAAGALVTRWDGTSFKTHPVTGEPVPDEAAQVPQWTYVNPRQAVWPAADFIVGNPPFIGASAMRSALGDGYTEALRGAWPSVPESADFVMYWWDRAALTVRLGAARQFGLITTNSLRQTFNRRVVERALSEVGAGGEAGKAVALMLPNAQKSGADLPRPAAGKLSLVFAIPDHPWVDSAQGAAVRIGMTVGARTCGNGEGRLLAVSEEHSAVNGEVEVRLDERSGVIHADLSAGADLSTARPMRANLELSNRGVQLFGAGFIVTRPEALELGLGQDVAINRHIREYRNGRDLSATSRDVLVIDMFGLSADQVRAQFPKIYQWLLARVKPERDQNNRAIRREKWWLFGETNPKLRIQLSGLRQYVATVETSKHRTFQFLDATILPDNKLVSIACSDALHLGVLSSEVHVRWALATGSWLGVGNDPVYVKSRCFETFPFPSDDTGLTPSLTDRIRLLAEQLDAHRKARQAAHDTVTLTGMYNVLDKLRSGEVLTAKDKLIHEQGLVSVLRTLHDDLDAAVLDAYGWGDLYAALADHAPAAAEARAAAVETLLERLVALNAKRAAEEAAGTVRWLRPEFQLRQRGGEQASIEADAGDAEAPEAAAPVAVAAPVAKRPWPAGLPEQIKAVADVLATTPGVLGIDDLASRFTARGRWRDRLPMILDTLEALGRARRDGMAWRG
ncbi:MAG: class I SAM-dependent DNA methyltransferase [Burkholderiaceae bacterium]|nr:class I SAM-dependent DNA methyltransferase [Burkholderiaceae bacterium]